MNYDELFEGDELPVETLDLASDFVRNHAAELGMEAGRFSSREEARAEGLPDQILPGIMSMGLLARLLLRNCPQARVTRIGTTFRILINHPTLPTRRSGKASSRVSSNPEKLHAGGSRAGVC